MKRMCGGACALVALGGSAIVFGAASAGAQGAVEYDGLGFVQTLSEPGAVGQVAFGDFGGDGFLDLAHCSGDGTLTLHDRFAEYDHTEVLAEELECFAVTRTGGDRMWTVEEDLLAEISVGGDAGPGSSLELTELLVSSPSVFRAQERLNALLQPISRLLVIDGAGARARVCSIDPPAVLFEHPASTEEQTLRDLALADWDDDGDDEIVILSNSGLRVYDAAGAVPPIHYPSIAEDAFLDVLPAADTTFGHDLVFFHCRQSVTAPALLWVLNAEHVESIYVDPLNLGGVCFADFKAGPTVEPRPELILPLGNARGAVIVTQAMTGFEMQPIFGIDFQDVNIIDLAVASEEDAPSVPAAIPATAVADIDADGDEDVLFADDRGLGMVVASAWKDADLLRSRPGEGSEWPTVTVAGPVATFNYDLVLDVPDGITTVEVEFWHQPDLESPIDPASWHTTTLTAPSFAGLISETAPALPGDDVYYILYRASATLLGIELPIAVWVEVWSPNPGVRADLIVGTHATYPWSSQSEPDEPGGTTRRPKINPGMGTGGH